MSAAITAPIAAVSIAILLAAIIAVARSVIADARLRPGGDPDAPAPCADPGGRPLSPDEQEIFGQAVAAYYGYIPGGDL